MSSKKVFRVRPALLLLLAIFLASFIVTSIPQRAYAGKLQATYTNAKGKYDFNTPSKVSPAIPNITYVGSPSDDNGLASGKTPYLSGSDGYIIVDEELRLNADFTKLVSSGNDRTLGFSWQGSARLWFSSTLQPAGFGDFDYAVTASIDICDPGAKLNGFGNSDIKNLNNWFTQTLPWLKSNTLAGVTDNPTLMQYVDAAISSNDGTKSTAGVCGSTVVDTATDTLSREIVVTVDLPEADWNTIVEQKLEQNYPKWFEYNLVSVATNTIIATKIVDISKVIGNADGQFTVTFKSDTLVPGKYKTAIFRDEFEEITKNSAIASFTDRYEGEINAGGIKYDNFFEYLKGRFPSDKNGQTVPTTGDFGVTADSAASDADLLGGTETDDNVTCESSGFSLSWVICPIINGSLDGAEAIFHGWVEPMLQTEPISTDTSVDNPIMDIWKAFRTIGNIVLIFALLFVVFGQSIGGGLVDAYTAKKTIPRILIAAILINLSVYICAILVDIFNVLGQGLARLIVTPVKDTGNLKITPDSGRTTGALSLGIIGGVLALVVGGGIFSALRHGTSSTATTGSALLSILPYVLLFIVLPIFLAILGIFLTLIFRRAIILMLVVISPIALALFAVPNADKYAKKWLDAFIKALMVYPIITGIFGISQVLAVITFNSSSDTGSITVLLATLIIAFAPLFMIPFSFKLAGGVIGGIANTVRSGRDNLKKMWGDDKHNPYSLRSRMGHAAAHRAQTQMTFGVAGMNNRVIGRIARRSGNKSAYEQAAAGVAASKASVKTHGDNEPARLSASKAATEAAKNGLNQDESKLAGSVAAEHAAADWTGSTVDHGLIGDAAGAAAVATQLNPEFKGNEGAIRAAAGAAAQARADNVTDEGELASIADAAAKLHLDSGGTQTLTLEGRLAAVAAHRQGVANGHGGKPRTRARVRQAARKSQEVIARGGTQDLARRAGAAAGRAADAAHEAANGLDRAQQQRAVDAAADQSARFVEAGETNAAYRSDAVHDAAGRAAASAVISGRQDRNPTADIIGDAAAAAALERATNPGTPEVADAAADAAGERIV